MVADEFVARPRHITGIVVERRVAHPNAHEPLGARQPKRMQHDGVERGKQRRVRADAERKRSDNNKRKFRRFAELAKSELQVVHITRCAVLEWDRQVWRGALELDMPTARRRPVRLPLHRAKMDRVEKFDKAERRAGGPWQTLLPDQRSSRG